MCDPVKVGSSTINSLSWADDLILMSTSEKGLQKCINKLSDYCFKWGFEINVNIKKCLIMSESRSFKYTFRYNNTELENKLALVSEDISLLQWFI